MAEIAINEVTEKIRNIIANEKQLQELLETSIQKETIRGTYEHR